MIFFEYFWTHWYWVAFLAPFFFALVNILDIYFIDSVYEDAWDGVLIASFSQSIPWLLYVFGFVPFHYPGIEALGLAFLGGGCLILSFFFYFKSLFITNDMVVVQTLWSLSIPLVPFLAWLIANEKLLPVHYVGIGLAFIGVLLFSYNKKIIVKEFNKVFSVMLLAVGFLSLSMVLQEQTYGFIGHDFWSGFLLFSTGATITGIVISLFDKKGAIKRFVHIVKMSKKYFLIFVLAEGLNLFGVLASQRAIDLSPAVSFVAVIESLQPAFVMLLSFCLVLVFYLFDKMKAQQIYQDQLIAFRTKMLACCIIVIGIYLIS